MVTVYIGPREDIDRAIKRFKKKCISNGIMDELKKKEYYVKPSDKKRIKRNKARKQREEELYEKENYFEKD